MGAGKEAPGGGDEPTQPPPVVLRMELHCAGCAKKVRKSIRSMPGVQSVVADAAANRVVVAGTADAAALKARIESRTKKPVEIVSSGAGAGPGPAKPPAAAPPAVPEKKSPDKENPDKGSGGADKGDKAGASQPQPPKEEDAAKKQPPTHAEEKKPTELQESTTVLLRIRLHCDGCADRIRRRIYKIKGVKDVVLEGNAKDEVKVTGTMDVPAMVAYLTEKLNRAVEAVAPGNKDKAGASGDEKKDNKGAGDGEKKDKAAAGDHVVMSQDKGKGIEVAGPSMASAAASMAPAPVQARTHHVSPYGQVPYPQPQGPPPSYYSSPYGGNADGAGYAGSGGYYQQQQHPGGYYQQHHPGGDAGGYYQQPREAGGYYQQQHPGAGQGGYYQQENPNPQAYPPPYHFDTAPPPQMFSDENPNSCSVM